MKNSSINIFELLANPPKRLTSLQKKFLEENEEGVYKYIQSIKDLSHLEKSNKYIKNSLDMIRRYIEDTRPSLSTSNLEAITYLKSRGMECGRDIELIVQYLDGEQQDEFYFRGIGFQNEKNLSIKEAKKLEPLSTLLECFWRESYNVDIYNDDAYFLRFIDWCKIDDFKEIWLNRLIKEYNQLSNNQDISEDIKMLLFNHCRSDYSIRLFKDSLLKLLHTYESIYFDQNGELITYKKDFIDYQAIAVIVFANIILKTVKPKVIKKGLEILTNNQNTNGGWSVNNKKKESDLLTSAVVIHAIAIAQEPYWQITINPCIEWIKSEQNVFGVWTSKVFDQIPFIVMILDALELAKGSTKVTFTIDRLLVSDTTKKQINTKVVENPINTIFPNVNMKDINWTDIGLDFCSADKIEIKIGKVKKKISIEEFGFKKAQNSWNLLFAISSKNGFIDYPTLYLVLNTKKNYNVQKNMSRLRKHLSSYFGISETPIVYNHIQHCYQTEFHYIRNTYQKKAKKLQNSDEVYFNPEFEELDEYKDDFEESDENIDF